MNSYHQEKVSDGGIITLHSDGTFVIKSCSNVGDRCHINTFFLAGYSSGMGYGASIKDGVDTVALCNCIDDYSRKGVV